MKDVVICIYDAQKIFHLHVPYIYNHSTLVQIDKYALRLFPMKAPFLYNIRFGL